MKIMIDSDPEQGTLTVNTDERINVVQLLGILEIVKNNVLNKAQTQINDEEATGMPEETKE